jgi:hypothetical protein
VTRRDTLRGPEVVTARVAALRGPRIGTTPTRGTLTSDAYARYLAEHDLDHLAQLEATRVVIAG